MRINSEEEGRRRAPAAAPPPPPQVVVSDGVNPYGAAAPLRHGNLGLMKCIFSDAAAAGMKTHIVCGFLKLDWDQ